MTNNYILHNILTFGYTRFIINIVIKFKEVENIKKSINYCIKNNICCVGNGLYLVKVKDKIQMLINNNYLLAEYDIINKKFESFVYSDDIRMYIDNKRLTIAEGLKEIEYLKYWVNEFKGGLD